MNNEVLGAVHIDNILYEFVIDTILPINKDDEKFTFIRCNSDTKQVVFYYNDDLGKYYCVSEFGEEIPRKTEKRLNKIYNKLAWYNRDKIDYGF